MKIHLFKLSTYVITHTVLLNLWGTTLQAQARHSVIFDQVVESQQKGPLFSARTWLKGKRLRMEYIDHGRPMISIILPDCVYNYDPEEKRGATVPVQQETYAIGPEILQSKAELLEFLTLMDAEKVGKFSLYGKNTVQYRFHDSQRDVSHILWLWLPYFFPIQMHVILPNDTIFIYYRNIKMDAAIPDTLFTVPPSIDMYDYTVSSLKNNASSVAE